LNPSPIDPVSFVKQGGYYLHRRQFILDGNNERGNFLVIIGEKKCEGRPDRVFISNNCMISAIDFARPDLSSSTVSRTLRIVIAIIDIVRIITTERELYNLMHAQGIAAIDVSVGFHHR